MDGSATPHTPVLHMSCIALATTADRAGPGSAVNQPLVLNAPTIWAASDLPHASMGGPMHVSHAGVHVGHVGM